MKSGVLRMYIYILFSADTSYKVTNSANGKSFLNCINTSPKFRLWLETRQRQHILLCSVHIPAAGYRTCKGWSLIILFTICKVSSSHNLYSALPMVVSITRSELTGKKCKTKNIGKTNLCGQSWGTRSRRAYSKISL